LRSRLETVGQETITGRRQDIVRATNGRVGDAFLVQKATQDIIRQQDMTALAKARLDAASGSISAVRETISEISASGRTTLSQNNNDKFALLSTQATDWFKQAMGALGRRSGTRHLFSGTNTAGGPLATPDVLQTAVTAEMAAAPDVATAITNIETFFNAPGGGFETNIY